VNRALRRELLLFCVSGVIGFAIDAAIVQWLVRGADADPYAARLVSFLAAACATWAFNRRWTFAGKRRFASRRGELIRYVAAMTGGFALNYGAYAACVWLFPLVREWPAIGVAVGSVAGAVCNYLTSKYWIFRSRQHDEP
jgi:putative flippase GtrA